MNSLPKSAKTKVEVWNEYKVVITECEEILAVLGDMHLPETKPRVLELTGLCTISSFELKRSLEPCYRSSLH